MDKKDRKIQISKNVFDFKKEIMSDINKYLPNSQLLSSKNFKQEINKLKGIDIIYPNIGENLDFISQLSKETNLKTNFLYREIDLYSWKYCLKGFFNFKKNIPNILDEIQSNYL